MGRALALHSHTYTIHLVTNLTLVLALAQLDRPLYDVANQNQPVAAQRVGYFVRAQRTRNYIRRMVPHIFGWFPMTAVWFILINQLQTAKRDLSEVTDRTIPPWVNAVILGTALIFMSFSFVCQRF